MPEQLGKSLDFSQPGLSCNADIYMACFCKVLTPYISSDTNKG